MEIIASQIRATIELVKPGLINISEENARVKPSPVKWSKKEILGHLIDSALNNHQRTVRAMLNSAADFPAYNQDEWVKIQKYSERDWKELVELFSVVNFNFYKLLEVVPAETLSNPVNAGKEKPFTLEFIITDYLRHLKHHLEQIIKS
ncbi:MAG: DinB family protein [Ignavibacteria bacterium]|nr:DinB family protein [Ignavibacteria bacterium]